MLCLLLVVAFLCIGKVLGKLKKTHIEIYVFSNSNKSLKQGITYDKNITLQKIEDKTLCFLDQLSEYNFWSP